VAFVTTTWSLFSGAMGLDLGLERAGVAPSFAVEIEPLYCETIRLNRPELNVLQADVTELTAADLVSCAGDGEVDYMVGGPPCQSFCPGGSRAALSDPRGNLIFEHLRLVSEVRPRRFVLENVSNLLTAAVRHRPIAQRPGRSWNLSSYSRTTQPSLSASGRAADEPPPLEPDEQSGSALRLLLDTVIAEMGYHVTFEIHDSSRFGAPQRRLRFVMVGDRDGPPPLGPSPTHGDGLLPFTTVREAIGDLVDEPGPGSLYTEAVRRVFDLVPEGGNWRDLPIDVAREAMGEASYAAGGGKTGFFRRLSWEGLAPTITGKANRKGSALCHPSQSRPLSVRECARLQGFPDDWHIAGAVNQQYQQVGNAVPVALGEAIGATLLSSSATCAPNHDTLLSAALAVHRASARNKRAVLTA
jgi:DNA (cytosine-5)-methyltransferase 1